MFDAITRKLHRFEPLGVPDATALDRLLSDERTSSPHREMIRVGTKPGFALAILSGWAIRYSILKDGSRQITSFLLPGDFCHLNILSQAPMDDSIAALSSVTAAHIKREDLTSFLTRNPGAARAAQESHFADESRLRALITNLGRRNAEQRLGYVLCELWTRANAVGLVHDEYIDFPPTQTDLADYLGLTPVHTNRVLQKMRREGLVNLCGRSLNLPDFAGLAVKSDYRRLAAGHDRDYCESQGALEENIRFSGPPTGIGRPTTICLMAGQSA